MKKMGSFKGNGELMKKQQRGKSEKKPITKKMVSKDQHDLGVI
jgi:hypothetical protein